MPEPEAAVAILHAYGNEESVLLMRRAQREDDPWSGQWSFPGGRRDPADGGLLQTALRELAEECGIQLSPEQVESALPPMYARRQVGPYLLVAPFLFRVHGELPAVPDLREAAETVWVPVRQLRDPTNHRLTPVPDRPPEFLFPAIEVGGSPCWGFTYRLIAKWLGLEPDHQEGFRAANRVLDFLLAQGLGLGQGWEDRLEPPAKAASVVGVIPEALVIAHFSAIQTGFPALNALEVRPEYVRMVGLAFEEYYIYS
jgi:8-oxo-dGTP pyrophosphatase MutT (NUDIX family)